MGVIVAPIVEVKLEAWKEWIGDLNGSRKEDLKDFSRRYGLTRHAAWLAETPNGPVVVAVHQGAGGDEFMGKLGASDNEFDRGFAAKILEVHGMDVSKPPSGPMPKLYLDSGSVRHPYGPVGEAGRYAFYRGPRSGRRLPPTRAP